MTQQKTEKIKKLVRSVERCWPATERVMLQVNRQTNDMREERGRKKKVSADSDSGYCSMMESGYSSNRDSASESKKRLSGY